MESPGAVRHPFLDFEHPIVYAHRGGGVERPENSMAAFDHAVSVGFRYLETDARLTADGVLVALHDDRLDRVSDGRGLVGELSAAEVTSARLLGPDGRPSQERVPLLEEVLTAWPQARWNLDAKDAATVEPLGDLLERLEMLERCCVGAFSDQRLGRLRQRFGPALCTVLGPREVARVRAYGFGVPLVKLARLVAPLGLVAQVPLSYELAVPTPRWLPRQPRVSVPIVDRFFLTACRRFGIPVHVWTVNEPAQMVALLDRGVAGFMTDRPTAAAELLTSRRQWPAVAGNPD